ncbi:hypothetical protein F7725_014409 [Dissostichus mawsoni]|uniref:Uncharacterized protein n=1 Tax=Dissostichus mawsoni TaxID=36200 RepID=A0A7J5YY17_DISMA|nr:hypothetical protein F7725_014409 [Dissostichus mawsoni]
MVLCWLVSLCSGPGARGGSSDIHCQSLTGMAAEGGTGDSVSSPPLTTLIGLLPGRKTSAGSST